MSKSQFSEQEMAFFDEGDTLSDDCAPAEDFADDLNETDDRSSGWASRALAAFLQVGPGRSES